MRKLLKHSLKTASLDSDGWHDVGQGPGSPEGDFIDWLTIADQHESVIEDVQRIRSHPLVPRDIPIYGYVYDVKTGRLEEVGGGAGLGTTINRQGRVNTATPTPCFPPHGRAVTDLVYSHCRPFSPHPRCRKITAHRLHYPARPSCW